jgi:hypothetical protein
MAFGLSGSGAWDAEEEMAFQGSVEDGVVLFLIN